MGPMKDWSIPERIEDAALARAVRVSPVTAHLLALRGLNEADRAQAFLRPSLSSLHEPALLPELETATERLARAVEAGERILICGDYDVDGCTGAAILARTLDHLGARVEVHIPNRDEGYGVNTTRLAQAVDDGVRVVVTVDNGIAALAEAAFCKQKGLDLIIADHHGFADALPEAVARVHPRLPGSEYPNPDLCGAGVAFKLAWGLAARLSPGGRLDRPTQDLLLNGLALVALGTVADVVSLTGENRVLVKYGLRALAQGRMAGLTALLEVSRVEGTPTAEDVAFRLAPRLNAAGRMGDARRAYRLLITDDPAEARALARDLDAANVARRKLQERVAAEARAQVEEVYGDPVSCAGIVVWSEGWPHGVVGIVAAKLAEAYRRPTLVASVEGERAKGSGRSHGGIDLLAALEPHRARFERLGGHAAALGFTVDPAELEDVRKAFDAGVRAVGGLAPDATPGEVRARLEGYAVEADVEVRLEELSRQLLDELETLSPFGQGNPEPLFAARGARVAGAPRLLGSSGRHVAFQLRQGDCVVRTVAFNRPDLWEELRKRTAGPGEPPTCQVAFRPRLNRWNGTTTVELELEAIQFD
ncbi:MAG: single-stranded-DNA-specific exonuclease RecJ [Planctomycetota bacterium]|nr:MAG: single-stranded-DNA-specific exonuclease RecJ [Planctomycetota bacterium]